MDILDDMGVSKLSAKVFSKVNYSFKYYLTSTIYSVCGIMNFANFSPSLD